MPFPEKSLPDAIEPATPMTNVNTTGNFSARIRVFVEKVSRIGGLHWEVWTFTDIMSL
ncbi:hypothetical protein ARTHRO9V_130271 [Arthrobacter sp. 9V]|nr:hypothetical protein ARTHRO9V_130271 [Arthrobacter sp. 9V]